MTDTIKTLDEIEAKIIAAGMSVSPFILLLKKFWRYGMEKKRFIRNPYGDVLAIFEEQNGIKADEQLREIFKSMTKMLEKSYDTGFIDGMMAEAQNV